MNKGKFIKLYNDCFGEDILFDKILFDTQFKNIRYISENGILISMLFAMDISLNGQNGKYIYAVCTDEKHRNKGYMEKLLKRVISEFKNGYGFLLLHPQNDNLARYYEKFGFKTLPNFKTEEFYYKTFNGQVNKITDENEYIKTRNSLATNGNIIFSSDFAKLVLSGYSVITDSKSSPSFIAVGDKDTVYEIIGDINGINAYMKHFKLDKVNVRISDNSSKCSMYLPLKTNVIPNEIYFGLILD